MAQENWGNQQIAEKTRIETRHWKNSTQLTLTLNEQNGKIKLPRKQKTKADKQKQ